MFALIALLRDIRQLMLCLFYRKSVFSCQNCKHRPTCTLEWRDE